MNPALWVVVAIEIASDAWSVVSVHATEEEAREVADIHESDTITYEVSRAVNRT